MKAVLYIKSGKKREDDSLNYLLSASSLNRTYVLYHDNTYCAIENIKGEGKRNMAADIKEALIQYCDVKQEYDDIRTRRDTLKRDIERMEKEQISVIDSVTGGNGGIQHYKIEGYPYPEYSRKRTLLIARDNQLQVYEIKLLEITKEVERFIEKIENSRMRRMITYRFLDDLTWFQVAQRMGKHHTEESCRKAVERFLKEI